MHRSAITNTSVAPAPLLDPGMSGVTHICLPLPCGDNSSPVGYPCVRGIIGIQRLPLTVVGLTNPRISIMCPSRPRNLSEDQYCPMRMILGPAGGTWGRRISRSGIRCLMREVDHVLTESMLEDIRSPVVIIRAFISLSASLE